jgi:hypothetical protein
MSASDRRKVLFQLAKPRRKRAHTAEMLRVLVQCAGLRAGVQFHATRLWRRRCCWRGVTLASAGCMWRFSLPSGMCSAPWAKAAALNDNDIDGYRGEGKKLSQENCMASWSC